MTCEQCGKPTDGPFCSVRCADITTIKRDPHNRRNDRAIAALPTIEAGQFGNLKLAWTDVRGDYRVWVSRMTCEDGARFDRAIEVEQRQAGSDEWVTHDRPNPMA